MAEMPPHVRARVQRILDGAARRLLNETDPDATRAAAGMDVNPSNSGSYQVPLLPECQLVPVLRGVDAQRGRDAAYPVRVRLRRVPRRLQCGETLNCRGFVPDDGQGPDRGVELALCVLERLQCLCGGVFA